METSAEHFSKEAATYDTTKPLLALLTEQAARELLERGLATPDTCVLDVGCGTGTLVAHLLPHVRAAVGVDPAQGMVDEFNKKMAKAGAADRASALCVDVAAPGGYGGGGGSGGGSGDSAPPDLAAVASKAGVRWPLPQQQQQQAPACFGLVTSTMSYHHMPDVAAATRAAASYLRPGGALAVFDLLREPGSERFHVQGKLHTVDHPGGFSASDLHTLLAGAGLSGIQVNVAHRFMREVDPLQEGGAREKKQFAMFVATGRKPLGGE